MAKIGYQKTDLSGVILKRLLTLLVLKLIQKKTWKSKAFLKNPKQNEAAELFFSSTPHPPISASDSSRAMKAGSVGDPRRPALTRAQVTPADCLSRNLFCGVSSCCETLMQPWVCEWHADMQPGISEVGLHPGNHCFTPHFDCTVLYI